MKVLYLPGLDGEASWIEKMQQQIQGIHLVPFIYPTGRDLEWERLTALVVSRLQALETGLLAGESFGGAVALKSVILHKQAVKGLCLISTFSHEAEPFAAALGRAATRMLPKAVLDPVARMLAGWKLAGTLKGEEREKFLRKFERMDHRELARRLKLLKGFDVSDRLVGITCPVEVMYGKADAISSMNHQLELWKRMPNAQVHGFEGYGHMITQEIPLEVARRIEAWAQRVEAVSGAA
jgi:pimeloyl-ACP methyl ester carboxylesterase